MGLWGSSMKRKSLITGGMCILALLVGTAAYAEIDSETQYVFDTFAFLVYGFLVMWMAAGFTMLEAGSVRVKSTGVICFKNLGLYAIAGIMFFLFGYNLMYVDVSGLIGSFTLGVGPSEAEIALLQAESATPEMVDAVVSSGYASMSDWFFQMVFVATTASIVSGALAERVKLWPFFAFIAVLTGLIYPVVGAWTWGGGWLSEYGFSDFAGSTIVHSTGGWAALAGVILVGPRLGKFRDDGTVLPTPASNIPLVTLGVFILWLGWFGFNGGSQLKMGSAADVTWMAVIFVNTNLAACGGVLAAIVTARLMHGKVSLLLVLNGAISGLVSITAAPILLNMEFAILVGVIGGVLCTVGMHLLEKFRVDDVVGAIPAHLIAGIWGTIAAAIFGGANMGAQLLGIFAIGAFVMATSFGIWLILKLTTGIRVSESDENLGQDLVELGMEAYPEFMTLSEDDIQEAIRHKESKLASKSKPKNE